MVKVKSLLISLAQPLTYAIFDAQFNANPHGVPCEYFKKLHRHTELHIN